MKLSVIVPTYNRAERLRYTLTSLSEAEIPNGLEVEVFVVDNDSSDATRAVVEEMGKRFSGAPLEYIFEGRQGKSFALNTGVRRSNGDLVTGIDDDIEIQKDWFIEVEKLFRERSEIDFAGGKMLPNWEDENVPDWIEPLKDGVLGWRDYGDDEWHYGENTPLLTGGHWIVRRNVFDEIGYFPEGLGATGKNLMSCEDDVFYDKLRKAGKVGIYCPKLVVYHFVPNYRVSKSYYRQWCFGVGLSWSLIDEKHLFDDEPKFLGIPRYLYRESFLNFFQKARNMFLHKEAQSLQNEKKILLFAGLFYGKHLRENFLGKLLGKLAGYFVETASR